MAELATFLWFSSGADEALELYSRTFADSEVVDVSRDPTRDEGSLMAGTVRIGGASIICFNGEPYGQFSFSTATSLYVTCEDQAEVDRYWEMLGEGGRPGQCGWLEDRFGVTWQIVPRRFGELMGGPDEAGRERVFRAMREMTKFDVAALESAYRGE